MGCLMSSGSIKRTSTETKNGTDVATQPRPNASPQSKWFRRRRLRENAGAAPPSRYGGEAHDFGDRSINRTGIAAHRRHAKVVAQPQLGLRAQWWPGVGVGHCRRIARD